MQKLGLEEEQIKLSPSDFIAVLLAMAGALVIGVRGYLVKIGESFLWGDLADVWVPLANKVAWSR